LLVYALICYGTRMNINVYLPDDLGERAKAAELPLSQLLRQAVQEELERREAVASTLTESQTYELELEGDSGGYTGRITGRWIAESSSGVVVYMTDDERVIAYDAPNLRYFTLTDDPSMDLDEGLRNWLAPDDAAYISACSALGIKPVLDL
jgi:hypothetical protein